MMGRQRAEVQGAWPGAAPLPLLLTHINTRRTSLPNQHRRCYLLFIFLLLLLLLLNVLLNVLLFFLLFFLFPVLAPVTLLCVCPQSQGSSLSFFQSLVLLLQLLHCTPAVDNGNQIDLNTLKLSGRHNSQQSFRRQSKHLWDKDAPHLGHRCESIPLQLWLYFLELDFKGVLFFLELLEVSSLGQWRPHQPCSHSLGFMRRPRSLNEGQTFPRHFILILLYAVRELVTAAIFIVSFLLLLLLCAELWKRNKTYN